MEEQTKKGMKTWEQILIIILVIIAIFVLDVYRKFKIIREVDKQYEADLKSTNFYQRTITGTGENITENFIYENRQMLRNTFYDEQGKTERTLYLDHDKKEFWLLINMANKKEAMQLEYQEDLPIAIISKTIGATPENLWTEIICAITSKIETDKWANKDCYHIKFEEGVDTWIDKESSRTIGERNGYNSGVGEYPVVTVANYYYKVNQLTEKDVELPDLTQYTIHKVQ